MFGCVSSQFYAVWEQNQASADFFGLFWAVRWIGRCINETMSVGRGEVCNINFFLRFLWELKLHGCHKVGRDRRSGLVFRPYQSNIKAP